MTQPAAPLRSPPAPDETIIGVAPSGAAYPVGKLEAHRRNLRHRAVSVFVFDGDRLLVQRRAASKYHSAGLWANTCCSHPLWGEEASACAARRLGQELGWTVPLAPFARLDYAAPVGALFENEVVDCFRGAARPGLDLAAFDPAEVQEVAWRGLDEIAADMAARPERYAPWFRIYLARHRSADDPFDLFA